MRYSLQPYRPKISPWRAVGLLLPSSRRETPCHSIKHFKIWLDPRQLIYTSCKLSTMAETSLLLVCSLLCPAGLDPLLLTCSHTEGNPFSPTMYQRNPVKIKNLPTMYRP